MTRTRRSHRLLCVVTLFVACALACGRYGKPIRPEPAPAPPPLVEESESVPDDTPTGEPDFRLDLPGVGEVNGDE